MNLYIVKNKLILCILRVMIPKMNWSLQNSYFFLIKCFYPISTIFVKRNKMVWVEFS